MRNELKKQGGITLIALVVTIVVLLILAGASIAVLTGDNGIITKSQEAKEETIHGQVSESMKMTYNVYKTHIMIDKATETFWEYLKENNIIDNLGNVNALKLTGNRLGLGNGEPSTEKDIYKFTEEDYILYYYNRDGEQRQLTQLPLNKENDTPTEEEPIYIATDAKYFDFSYNDSTQTATINGILRDYCPEYTMEDMMGYGELTEKFPIYIKDGEIEIRDIAIPKTVTKGEITYTVTAIKENAFDVENAALEAMMLDYPPSEITSLIIPDTIVAIGDSAFYSAGSLRSVIIEDGTSNLNIGNNAFSNCSSLEIIIIPNNVTSIGNNAFSYCNSLTNINIKKEENSIIGAPWGASNSDVITWNYIEE